MAAVTRLGLYGGTRSLYGDFTGKVAQILATLTGTATDGVLESEIVAGGETIVITLTNGTWVTAGATFNAQRQNIIDGLDSDGVEATGWNTEVRDNELVTSVVRTSDTVVTITLTAAPGYSVSSDETITATIPASAISGASEVTATPTFDVTSEAEAVEEEATGGGWLPESELRRLRKIRREARKREDQRIDDRLAEQERLRNELRATFNRVNGIVEEIPPDVEREVVEAAAQVTTVTRVENRLPIFEFGPVIDNAEALNRVTKALEGLIQKHDDEDAIMAILVSLD